MYIPVNFFQELEEKVPDIGPYTRRVKLIYRLSKTYKEKESLLPMILFFELFDGPKPPKHFAKKLTKSMAKDRGFKYEATKRIKDRYGIESFAIPNIKKSVRVLNTIIPGLIKNEDGLWVLNHHELYLYLESRDTFFYAMHGRLQKKYWHRIELESHNPKDWVKGFDVKIKQRPDSYENLVDYYLKTREFNEFLTRFLKEARTNLVLKPKELQELPDAFFVPEENY